MNKKTKHDENFSFFNSYIKGETLISGWRFVGNGLTLLNAFILISFLEVFKYGTYILVLTFLSLVSHLSLNLLQTVVLNDVVRFIGEGDEARAKRLFLENAALQLSIAFILSLAMFFGADLVASLYDKDIASLIRIVSPFFLITALNGIMRMFFNTRLFFGLVAVRPVIYKIIRLVLLVSFILFTSLNVKNALLAHIIASFLSVLIFVPFFIRTYASWRKIKTARERILWRIAKSYGKWSIFGGLFKSSVLDMKPWLIKFFINTEAVAIYSVADMLYGSLKKLLPTKTLKVLVPRVAHDRDRAKNIVLRSVKYLFLTSVILGVFGAIIVPLLIQFLFPNYSESIPLFYILLFALPFLSFRSPARAFIIALRRQRFIFILGVVVSVNAFLTPFILLPLIGVAGMAVERIVTAVIISAITFWYLSREGIPLSSWLGIFKFDKHDKALLIRLVHIFRERVYKKTKIVSKTVD